MGSGNSGKVLMVLLAVCSALLAACGGKIQYKPAPGSTIFERMRNTNYEVKITFPGWENWLDEDKVVKAFNDRLAKMGYPGLKIKLDGLDWGSWTDRANAIVLSGGDYDLVFSPDWGNFYNDAKGGGAWQPWDPFIDQVPEFAALIEPWRDAIGEYMGYDPDVKHIYRMITIKEYASYLCEARWNRNVADKLGITQALRNVKSLADLEPYMEMYKKAYPNNGMAIVAPDTDPLVSCFMPNASMFKPSFDLSIGKFRTGVFSAWFDQYVAQTRSWYAKGYIPDYEQTESYDDLIRKFGPESFLVYFNVGKPGGEEELNQNSKDLNGFLWGCTYLTKAYITLGSLMSNSWAINSRSRNPEATAFVYMLLETDRGLTNLLNFGIEGVHYTMDNTSTMVKTADSSRYFPNLMWMFGNRFLCNRLPGEPENLAQLYEDFNQNAILLPDFGFQWPTDLSVWKGVDTDMFWGVYGAITTQYKRSIQTGTITDSQIADIRTKLTQANSQGMDRVLNKAFDEWKSPK